MKQFDSLRYDVMYNDEGQQCKEICRNVRGFIISRLCFHQDLPFEIDNLLVISLNDWQAASITSNAYDTGKVKKKRNFLVCFGNFKNWETGNVWKHIF